MRAVYVKFGSMIKVSGQATRIMMNSGDQQREMLSA